MEKTKTNQAISTKELWIKHKVTIASYSGLLFCILLFSIVTPLKGQSIWSPEKLSTLMSDVIVTALMAVGAVFIYSLGNIDISIGNQIGLYATVMVLLGNATGSLILGIVVSLLLSVVIGTINGACGPIFNIIPIIPSVVIMQVLSGVATVIYSSLGTRNISLKSIDYSVFRSPVLMLVVLVIEVGVATFLFNYTRIGKYAKVLGANKTVAIQSGVSVLKYRVLYYIIAGISFVLAALFQMGYTGSASDSTGTGFSMNVMIAIILGGMPISGGMRSRVSAAVVGAFTFSILDVGLPLVGLPTRMIFIVKAIIFLIVVLMTSRKKTGMLPK
jgi:ribose transport system permease protein